jgi:mannobiose 2-epimerase
LIQLQQYKKELQQELASILNFWERNTIDKENGGFYGKLDNQNKVYHDAPKGSVLNSRILWAFSAAYNLTGNKDYLHTAERAFQFIQDHFIDKKNGGVYWSVDYKGNPLETKKQIYALSFAIYGLSEFYKSCNNHKVVKMAIDLYECIIKYSLDTTYGGYLEALTEDWKEIKDLRLSTKDANEKKSMNTHLHVLEGFANLFMVWSNETLKKGIIELITIFQEHIIDKKSNHLILFFDEKWNVKSNIISYGHDIEAAWLIQEAAEIIKDEELIKQIKSRSAEMADAAAEGLDKDGGLSYELGLDTKHLVKEKHWWPQAESMIGYFNAWQITGKEHYLEKSWNSWIFIKDHIIDKKSGEWFWGVKEDYVLMEEDKVGTWKCPYHNTRACIELIKRVQQYESTINQKTLKNALKN